MKVKDVIKHMQDYHLDDEIFIMWWNNDSFIDSYNMTDNEWDAVVNILDKYGFDSISETVVDAIEEEIDIIRRK